MNLKDSNNKSALSVLKGVNQVNQLDENTVSKFKDAKKSEINTDEFLKEILAGNITYLGKAITLIESSKSEHRIKAQEIINKCMPYSGNTIGLYY